MPRPPSSRPHDAEAGHEPPAHASGLAPSALIHALDDLQPDPLNANRGTDRGRAIDPAAVERMCDATRGAHISPGELEHIWRGRRGPPPIGPGLIRPGRGTALASTGPRSATPPSPPSCAARPRRSSSLPSTAPSAGPG